jgi:hypothetical protein
MPDTVCVHVVGGEFAAQQVRAFLADRGIPCELRGEALRNIHGFTLDGLGEVRIHVATEHADEARALLAKVESGELELPDVPTDADPS